MGMYEVSDDTFELNPEIELRAGRLMRRVWENIAPDALDGRTSIRRAEIVELVMDANRMEDRGDDEAARYAAWMQRFHPIEFKVLCGKTFALREG